MLTAERREEEGRMQQAEPKVVSGQVVALRLFDLAYEIDLRRAEALWLPC